MIVGGVTLMLIGAFIFGFGLGWRHGRNEVERQRALVDVFE